MNTANNKKANKGQVASSAEETKANRAKASASKSPAGNKRGKMESAPAEQISARGRPKTQSSQLAAPPKQSSRSGAKVPPPTVKSASGGKKPSKSPGRPKNTTAAAKKGKEPEPMSDEEAEESKVSPPPKGKGKKSMSSVAEEKPTTKGGKKAMTEEKGKKKVGKIVDEPKGVKPTRPIASYIFFSNEEVPKVVAAQGCTHKEAMKIVGAKWQTLQDEQKKPYIKKHEDDKRRYEAQLEELKKKGYFIMSDGSKSTDFSDPPRKQKVKSTDATPRPVKKRSSAAVAK